MKSPIFNFCVEQHIKDCEKKSSKKFESSSVEVDKILRHCYQPDRNQKEDQNYQKKNQG